MKHSRKILTVILPAVLFFLCAAGGCDNASPQIAGTPTPGPTATPTPQAWTLEVTGAPYPTDELGGELGDENHYWRYLSFGDIRVYEYQGGTFWDGVCVNGYLLPLDGEVEVAYYNAEGKIVGRGKLHTADGGTTLQPGSNAVYGEIMTDIDVRMLDFQMQVIREFQPVEPEG